MTAQEYTNHLNYEIKKLKNKNLTDKDLDELDEEYDSMKHLLKKELIRKKERIEEPINYLYEDRLTLKHKINNLLRMMVRYNFTDEELYR